jgi:hypothetical protein
MNVNPIGKAIISYHGTAGYKINPTNIKNVDAIIQLCFCAIIANTANITELDDNINEPITWNASIFVGYISIGEL